MQRELCVQYLTEISASTVQWLTILNQQSPEDPNTVRQVALQLQILLKICTHVDFEEESSPPIETHQFNSQPIKSPHPIVGVVQQVAPVICLTAERFNANENIIKDCCDIFNGALRNTSEEFLPFLQPYSNLLLSSYSLKPQAPILASAAILASMYRSGEQAQIIAPMTEELVRQSLVAFNQDLHGNTELVAAFFHAMKRVLNKADPVMLFRLDAMLESVIQCAVASLQLPEIPAIKATCSFLSIAAYTPRSTMKEPVLVLFTLKRHCPQEFQATLSQAVHESPKTAGVTPDEKTKFLKRIVNARKRTDLVPIANDFSLLARKLG
ncbi:hypothetical protein SARC_01596 [Sphaeroforma arctica JP610]|uniref:Uncharacterized protein n=1 Tax=Sphaeroforma arctica JP610 TaxID=667725 RepID=A0A0L0GBI7_9EUKA|nr:hypothetical protein SARC_01596 [Sphaeroforma arctica JP610]KNC86274.1 hypothetical protein SARC_01596 [Sphaeroforma arctica JP610]|eukprot:XP_014160176.1 hypothetical protein SARC_01596 [Sphaeroforma arctica JP610]